MELNSYIDHTLLKANVRLSEIDELCAQAVENNFCAVCVNPCNVAYAKQRLQNSQVKVCTVIGFPLGQNTTETKVFEAQNALASGADEIDMVINVGRLLDGDLEYVAGEIAAVRNACKGSVLKVIIETCYLEPEQIKTITSICVTAGADFVKTSTGFGTRGASLDDVKTIKSAAGNGAQIKASGGIKTREFAETLILAGATRIGTSSGVQLVKEQKR